jgi:hypothetical protein
MERQEFQTSDVALAAFLYYHDAVLADIDRSIPGRCVFVFELTPEHQLEVAGWRDGSAMVGALAYSDAYRAMKARIFRRDRDMEMRIKNET